jgi:hypothetical protein
MTERVFKYLTLLSLIFLLCSWGEKGHQKINSTAPQFFPSGLNKFHGWSEILSLHGSDPDNRRKLDPTEGIKHYIDFDGYDDFVKTHKIVEGKDEAFNKYGTEFIKKNGTLPWVTDSVYHVLVKEFKAKDWSKVVLSAADLGHYVGDGHMPLHLTLNYDGQLTQQKGIHNRYESKMFGLYTDSITVKRSRLHKVKNVQRYVFDYMYSNFKYKDSLLNADKYAYEKANNEYNDLYYEILWHNTKAFTDRMIRSSSKSLAELIRMAWIEAGRPRVPKEISMPQ